MPIIAKIQVINEAIKRDADVLVLLDSYGQHDPDEIPVLINPISEDGYDLATGTRKLKSSIKIENWEK